MSTLTRGASDVWIRWSIAYIRTPVAAWLWIWGLVCITLACSNTMTNCTQHGPCLCVDGDWHSSSSTGSLTPSLWWACEFSQLWKTVVCGDTPRKDAFPIATQMNKFTYVPSRFLDKHTFTNDVRYQNTCHLRRDQFSVQGGSLW